MRAVARQSNAAPCVQVVVAAPWRVSACDSTQLSTDGAKRPATARGNDDTKRGCRHAGRTRHQRCKPLSGTRIPQIHRTAYVLQHAVHTHTAHQKRHVTSMDRSMHSASRQGRRSAATPNGAAYTYKQHQAGWCRACGDLLHLPLAAHATTIVQAQHTGAAVVHEGRAGEGRAGRRATAPAAAAPVGGKQGEKEGGDVVTRTRQSHAPGRQHAIVTHVVASMSHKSDLEARSQAAPG